MIWYLLRSEAAISRPALEKSSVLINTSDEKGTLQQVFLNVCKMLLMLVVY